MARLVFWCILWSIHYVAIAAPLGDESLQASPGITDTLIFNDITGAGIYQRLSGKTVKIDSMDYALGISSDYGSSELGSLVDKVVGPNDNTTEGHLQKLSLFVDTTVQTAKRISKVLVPISVLFDKNNINLKSTIAIVKLNTMLQDNSRLFNRPFSAVWAQCFGTLGIASTREDIAYHQLCIGLNERNSKSNQLRLNIILKEGYDASSLNPLLESGTAKAYALVSLTDEPIKETLAKRWRVCFHVVRLTPKAYVVLNTQTGEVLAEGLSLSTPLEMPYKIGQTITASIYP